MGTTIMDKLLEFMVAEQKKAQSLDTATAVENADAEAGMVLEEPSQTQPEAVPQKELICSAEAEESMQEQEINVPQQELTSSKEMNSAFQSRLQEYLASLTEEGREKLLFDYEIRPHGIYRLLRNSKTGEINAKLLVSYTPVLISNILVDITTKIYQVELEVFWGGKWNRLTPVPKSKIGTSRGIVDLANYNLDVTCQNARLLVQYLQLLSHIVGSREPMLLLSKLGWYDGVFNLPGREAENVRLQIKDNDLQGALKDVQGKELEWLSGYLRLCQESLSGRFVLACSFCAPLLEMVEFRGSPLVLLYGEKGTGKTTIMRMAASFWGSEKLIYGFDGTINGFETHAQNMDGLPLFLDDVQQMGKGKEMEKFLQTLIYMLHNGKGKLRAGKDTNAAQVKRWHTMNIISSEQTLVTKTMTGGAGRRILELELEQRLSKESMSFYNNLVTHCHGCAKEPYLRFLERTPREVLQKSYNQVRDQLFALDKCKHEDTAVSMLALIVVADFWARYVMIYSNLAEPQQERSGKLRRDVRVCSGVYREKRDGLDDADAADVADDVMEPLSYEEALLCCIDDSMEMGVAILKRLPYSNHQMEAMEIYEGLVEVVNKYRKYFGYSANGTTMDYSNPSYENYGFFYEEDVYIRPHVFADFIKELGYRDSMRSIRKRLVESGFITGRNGESTITKYMVYNNQKTSERYVCLHMNRGEEQKTG